MRTRTVLLGLGGVALALGLAAWIGYKMNLVPDPFRPSLERGEVLPVAEYRFSGPHTHDNLTVYLVHGRETLPGAEYLTLKEALEQNKVVVHETENVNQLSIENLSDEEVFVQAGDVVKGGKQDRTIPYDFIAPARSGRLPIDSFCVEQGRWAQRGKESKFAFSDSSYSLSGKELKLASHSERSQGEVWDKVARLQVKIAANLGKPELESESKSSFQLTNEHPELQQAIRPYLAALESARGDAKDVLGVVILVNGQVSSAEVFGSATLFAKVWPKLLHSAAVEAFAEREKDKEFTPISLDAVKEFLAGAEEGVAAREAVTERVYVHVQQSSKHVLFDTCDRGRRNVVIHRTILAR